MHLKCSKKIYCLFFTILLFSTNSYSSASNSQIISSITTSVEKLCKAPSNEKSSFYKVSAEGKADLKVKLIGLAGANAKFKRKEWEGVQRVLQKDQADDNKNYRNCTVTLTPIFLEKFSGKKEESNKAQTSKSMLAYHGDAEITLKSCTQKSQTIKCFLSIKNTADTDIQYSINADSFLIDHKGNQYRVTKLKFGNVTKPKGYGIKKLLLPNLPIDMEFSFSKLGSSGDIIPLFRFETKSTTDFRNIPISR